MNYSIELPPGEMEQLERDVEAAMERARPAAQAAMAKRFHEITLNNFGIAGAERPMHWPPLSTSYAEEVGRDIATLKVSGALMGAVKWDPGTAEGGATVSVNDDSVPYAVIHYKGGMTHPTVTAKSKKFFWAKFFKTGNEMWKYLALKQVGTKLNIKIPARPYMPIDDNEEPLPWTASQIAEVAVREVEKELAKANG